MMVVGGRVTRLGVPKSAATAGTAEVLHIEAFDPSVEWHEADLEAKVESVRSDIKTLDPRLEREIQRAWAPAPA